jgi:hypothetical protein
MLHRGETVQVEGNMDYKSLWFGLEKYLESTEDRVTKKQLQDTMKSMELEQARDNDSDGTGTGGR